MIRLSHGNAKLNFESIARELGVEVRTLQRYFREAFGVNMKQYTVQTRMEFAAHLLAQEPSPKISFVASRLGYETDRGFLRFVAGRIERRRSEAKPRKEKRRAVQSASGENLDIG
jgi:AraC-like DNA-binding protein